MRKAVVFALLLVALFLVIGWQFFQPGVAASIPSPSPSETVLAAAPVTATPLPTPDPEEQARLAHEALLGNVADIVAPVMPSGIDARGFLSWLEAGPYPDVLIGVMSDDYSPAADDFSALLYSHTGETLHVLCDRFSGLIDSADIVKTANSTQTVLAFGGDVNLVDGSYAMPTYVRNGGDVSKIFKGGLLDEMRAADVFMVNNEFAFTDRGTANASKGYTFRSKPENVHILNDMGVDLAFVANNHVFDYGAVGLLDTLDTLDSAGIAHVGAGADLADAVKPVYFIVDGRKIAFVAGGTIERFGTIFTPCATEDSPGILRADDKSPDLLLAAVQEAKANSDFVVVSVHWGVEGTSKVEAYQKNLAHRCIDAGADAVIGHHPHVLQGTEFYEGKPIVYSIGNFWFSSVVVDSCLLELLLDKDGGVSVKFLPCTAAWGYTALASGDEAARVINDYQRISFGVNIAGDGIITDNNESL
ncbi:MAG: CapA family protein [Firmicutes bacterium]|nr:CapA family protein [Bacillota bacterium]